MSQKQDNKLEVLGKCLSKAFESLTKEDIGKAEQFHKEIKKVMKRLEPEEVGMLSNQVNRLEKEIRLFKRKIKMEQAKEAAVKAATVTAAVLAISMAFLFLKPSITGFHSVGVNVAPTLETIPQFQLNMGEEFIYRARANDANLDELIFTDDTKLFNITQDGLIRFTPTKSMQGKHYIAIITKDMRGGIDIQVVKFLIGVEEEPIQVQAIEEEVEEIEEEPVREIIDHPINGTINMTLEMNATEIAINDSDDNISDLNIENNVSMIINQTTETLNLTNQTD